MSDQPESSNPTEKAKWEIRLGIVSAAASLCTLAVGGYVAVFLSRAELGELVKMNRFESLEAKLNIIEQLGVDSYYDDVVYLYGENKYDTHMDDMDIGLIATFHNRGSNVVEVSHYSSTYVYNCDTGKSLLASSVDEHLDQQMNALIGWAPGNQRFINANSSSTRIEPRHQAQILHKFPLSILPEGTFNEGETYTISFTTIFYSTRAAAIALGTDHFEVTNEYIDRIPTPHGKLIFTPILSRKISELIVFTLDKGKIATAAYEECETPYVEPIVISDEY